MVALSPAWPAQAVTSDESVVAVGATLLAPVPMPPSIIGIGLNYRQHAIDANLSIPSHPAVFFKGRFAHNDPLRPVVIPPQSSLPDYEGELAVVISKNCKDATLETALDCVLGYTAANDVSKGSTTSRRDARM